MRLTQLGPTQRVEPGTQAVISGLEPSIQTIITLRACTGVLHATPIAVIAAVLSSQVDGHMLQLKTPPVATPAITDLTN